MHQTKFTSRLFTKNQSKGSYEQEKVPLYDAKSKRLLNDQNYHSKG